MTHFEARYADLLAELRASPAAPVPEGLRERLRGAVLRSAPRRPLEATFDEWGELVAAYLRALLGPVPDAEELLLESLRRAAAKGSPSLGRTLQAARHVALEALADASPDPEGADLLERALVLERGLGVPLEELCRTWSAVPLALRERLSRAGARLLASVEGSADPCAHAALLPAALLDLLDEEEATTYAEHLESCPSCAERAARLEEIVSPSPRPLKKPAALQKPLAAGGPDAGSPRLEMPIDVAVACCYCHERFGPHGGAYCAVCLAPHHPDCFGEHGGCATPGCVGTRLVLPQEASPPSRSRRPRLGPMLGLAVGTLLAGGGAAALVSYQQFRAQQEDYARKVAALAEDHDHAYDLPAEWAPAPGEGPTTARIVERIPPRSGGVVDTSPRVVADAHDSSRAATRPHLRLRDGGPLLEVSAGDHDPRSLLRSWAEARSLALSVDEQAAQVRVHVEEDDVLDRSQLRALLSAHDLLLVVGPGNAARVLHVRNAPLRIGTPQVAAPGDEVDPDAFVSYTVPLQNPETGATSFATLRGILSRDPLRIANILYAADTGRLTLIHLAHQVRSYEELLADVDQPKTALRARLELYRVPAERADELRDTPGPALYARLRSASAASEGVRLLRSQDVDFDALPWQGATEFDLFALPLGSADASAAPKTCRVSAVRLEDKPPLRAALVLRTPSVGEVYLGLPRGASRNFVRARLPDGSVLFLFAIRP